jgi:hypothetical protein
MVESKKIGGNKYKYGNTQKPAPLLSLVLFNYAAREALVAYLEQAFKYSLNE